MLGETDRATADTPVFRHASKAIRVPATAPKRSATTTTLLNLARDIRGNATSERRRPKLLPPPNETELPFLKGGRNL